ncbi:MAG: Rne/Rng family ribonuclease [Verrucomicrobiaceae bacterium]|nr:Rne/Rng family ribonuclease [Verrucomicrobiaceae bacterium]
MLDTFKKLFGFSAASGGSRIVVNCEPLETRVAVLEDKTLEEYTIERTGQSNIVGSIFKGRVKNIEGGLKAMFVDIGFEKNAFLHFWDAIPAALDCGLEEIKRSTKKKNRITSKDIPDIYPVGSEVLVQVTKGPIGNKGPRVTTNISLPGRFMVLMPRNDQFGISRKIDDPQERQRLRKICERLSVPENMGIIMRTVCQGKRARFFVRDLRLLLEQWDEIDERQNNGKAPLCVFQEPGLVERTVRDFLTDEVAEVLCDDEEVTEEMRELVSSISRRAKKRINFYQGKQPIFDKLGINRQIENAFHRQVWMPCGGYLCIDETEALIAVDVNTGRNKGHKGNMDKMILETNLEAADEVSRQLKLRNIGGLVVVDFIDMKGRKDQMAVYRRMRDRVRKDKAKTQILHISQLGLMEMTRQRLNESLTGSVMEPCSYCQGKGSVKSTMTMSVELQRRLNLVFQSQGGERSRDLIVVVHPDVMHRLRTEDEAILEELQRRNVGRLTFRADPTYHREQVMIVDAASNEEITVGLPRDPNERN